MRHAPNSPFEASVSFLTGFFAPARGYGLIATHPRLRLYAILPFMISFAVFIACGGWGLVMLWQWLPALAHLLIEVVAPNVVGATATALYVLVLVFLWPTALFFLLYALFVVNKIVGSPFHALLAEYLLIEEGVLEDRPFGLGHWLVVSVKMFFVSLLKAMIFIGIGLVLFVLSFIPVLNVLAGFVALLVVAFDLSDYAFEAMQMSFGQRVKFFTENIPAFSGIAVAMGLVFFVPGLNFFLFPACVAGASDVVRRILRAKHSRVGSAVL